MSLPNEIDFALIKMGDGETVEAFTTVCGIQDVTINGTANTSDRAVRDCDAPGATPTRKTKLNSKQLDIAGTGLSNSLEAVRLEAALGVVNNYKIETYRRDGTDAGKLLGTYSGAFRMTANNVSAASDGVSSADINLANEGPWIYTDASGS